MTMPLRRTRHLIGPPLLGLACAAFAAPDTSRALADIAEQDQAVRRPGTGPIDAWVLTPRDEQRRHRVRSVFWQGDVRTERAPLNAVLVCQHGAKHSPGVTR